MATKYLYAAYEGGEPLGERTSREWEHELSIPRQTIRDYAREGRTYGGRYTFQMIEKAKPVPKEAEARRSAPEIVTVQELEKFKRSVKIGARFDYESYRKDFVLGSRIVREKVMVVRTFSHTVLLASIDNPGQEVTMTYAELLEQKVERARKRKQAAGRQSG
ncbi:hypothetical protein AALB39_27780 [Lachnospiraceae bacterium 54-53]